MVGSVSCCSSLAAVTATKTGAQCRPQRALRQDRGFSVIRRAVNGGQGPSVSSERPTRDVAEQTRFAPVDDAASREETESVRESAPVAVAEAAPEVRSRSEGTSSRGSQEDAEELTLDTLPQVAASAPAPGPLISPQLVRMGVGLGVATAGVTLAVAAVRVALKWGSPASRRARTVNKNKVVVDAIAKYLPGNRARLTDGVARGVCKKTGYTPTEVFRKYLWYMLQEREFNEEAVGDMVHLKMALGLTDDQVAEALAERARRIRSKMGPIMFGTKGMTAEGIARKATERALFSKLLYLSDRPDLLDQDSMAREHLSIPDCFQCTNPSDVERMRIVSLEQIDMDTLEMLATTGPAAERHMDDAEGNGDKGKGQ